MNHKLIIAAASAFVYVRNEMNSMDDIFMANVEALVRDEGTSVSVCYLRGDDGEIGWAQFCDYHTSSSMIYPCSSTNFTRWYKKGTSYCTR